MGINLNIILALGLSFIISYLLMYKFRTYSKVVLVLLIIFVAIPLILEMILYNLNDPSTIGNIKMYLRGNYDEFNFWFKSSLILFSIVLIFIPNKKI